MSCRRAVWIAAARRCRRAYVWTTGEPCAARGRLRRNWVPSRPSSASATCTAAPRRQRALSLPPPSPRAPLVARMDRRASLPLRRSLLLKDSPPTKFMILLTNLIQHVILYTFYWFLAQNFYIISRYVISSLFKKYPDFIVFCNVFSYGNIKSAIKILFSIHINCFNINKLNALKYIIRVCQTILQCTQTLWVTEYFSVIHCKYTVQHYM